MSDFRAYCQPPEREPSEIHLSAEERHHLVTVNRAEPGDTVVAFDGRGNEWICELAGDERRGALLKVRFRQQAKPLPYEITLGQALPKGQFMDAIVRKATELGVARIAPLESDASVGVVAGFYAADARTLMERAVAAATMPAAMHESREFAPRRLAPWYW
jgi:16S rRNA (uracil1498-N3)-methyltransferase